MFEGMYHCIKNSITLCELNRVLSGLPIDTRAENCPFLTLAGQLAFEGENQRVRYMLLHGASLEGVVEGYAIAGNHAKVDEYYKKNQGLRGAIARGYAFAGNHGKVDEYSKTAGQASIDHCIAHGYVFAGNDAKVEEYRIKYKVSVDLIAKLYAHLGRHDKVEAYRRQHQASVDAIAVGYAFANNTSKVRLYRDQYKASVHSIAEGYAITGNHAQVERYRNKYGASIKVIAQAYHLAGFYGKVKKYVNIINAGRALLQLRHGPSSSPLGRNGVFSPAIANRALNQVSDPQIRRSTRKSKAQKSS